jgi:hypothetical protein
MKRKLKRKFNPILLTKARLEVNLENLSLCCAPVGVPAFDFVGVPGSSGLGFWPSHEILAQIEDDVLVLAQRERKKPIVPVWKAFEQVDRRETKLPLKLEVNDLISRALAMLPGESELNKVVRLAIAGDDIVMKPEKLAKLLQDERQMERQRCMAQPLAQWIVTIGHPMAKAFESIAGFAIRDAIWDPIREVEIIVSDVVRRAEHSESMRRSRF